MPQPNLLRTPLHALHVELGAKMVPFAGYEMPVQYPAGVLEEHLQTRRSCGLFDVSHMGQVDILGKDRIAALETLVPGDVAALAEGRTRYTLLTNESGGIEDDLMVTNAGDRLFLVINAARKVHDVALLRAGVDGRATVDVLSGRALLALQGPLAVDVMSRMAPETASMSFMSWRRIPLLGIPCFVGRSGYTGEDGFEISVPEDRAETLARALLDQPEVGPVGLGARDSLRLEAGLCLYGSDIDTNTTPVEAGLSWTISKRRREQGGFPGDAVIRHQLAKGPSRLRVGIRPVERAPARAHTVILDEAGRRLGEVTSGGFGPSVNGAVAMGYVDFAHAKPETPLQLIIREKARPAHVVPLPFVAHNYRKA